MKLYVLAGACSMVPHTALEWAKTPYELEIVDHKKIKSPEYLALNPQGAVPLLVDDDFILAQNIAILQYLHSTFPAAKIFGTGDLRQQAKVWQWLAFCNADLHKSFGPLFNPGAFLADQTAHQALVAGAREKIVNLLASPDKAVADGKYLTGELTIADVYLYVVLRWAKIKEIDVDRFAGLSAFFARVEEDPGVQAVLIGEQLTGTSK